MELSEFLRTLLSRTRAFAKVKCAVVEDFRADYVLARMSSILRGVPFSPDQGLAQV